METDRGEVPVPVLRPVNRRKLLGDNVLQLLFDDPWHRKALMGDRQAINALAQHALGPLYRFCFYRVGREPTPV